jgi:hypothetical protein
VPPQLELGYIGQVTLNAGPLASEIRSLDTVTFTSASRHKSLARHCDWDHKLEKELVQLIVLESAISCGDKCQLRCAESGPDT